MFKLGMLVIVIRFCVLMIELYVRYFIMVGVRLISLVLLCKKLCVNSLFIILK